MTTSRSSTVIDDYNSSLCLDITELTAASRSILYSAHLLWESSNCILIAAGTAFGEIMYWSWSKSAQGDAITQIHQVFLGHEGSIFDVHISKELQRGCCGNLKRVIASCSDDRTIRLWDVSNMDVNATDEHVVSQDYCCSHDRSGRAKAGRFEQQGELEYNVWPSVCGGGSKHTA